VVFSVLPVALWFCVITVCVLLFVDGGENLLECVCV